MNSNGFNSSKIVNSSTFSFELVIFGAKRANINIAIDPSIN